MTRFKWFLLASLLSNTAFAAISPLVIRFNEGELFSVRLSKFNYNRIDVEGEKITRVRFTEGNFLVDRSDVNDSADGSVYLKPLTDTSMTVFITTEENHHFSLSVTPDEGAGKTVHFVSNQPKAIAAVHWEKNDSYLNKIRRTMKVMLDNKVPTGFDTVEIHEQPFFIQKRLKMQLLKFYRGAHLVGHVYQIQNVSKQMVELTPDLFTNKHLRALVFSEKQLSPNQEGRVYSLIGETAGV